MDMPETSTPAPEAANISPTMKQLKQRVEALAGREASGELTRDQVKHEAHTLLGELMGEVAREVLDEESVALEPSAPLVTDEERLDARTAELKRRYAASEIDEAECDREIKVIVAERLALKGEDEPEDEDVDAIWGELAAPPRPAPLPFGRLVTAIEAFCSAYLSYREGV